MLGILQIYPIISYTLCSKSYLSTLSDPILYPIPAHLNLLNDNLGKTKKTNGSFNRFITFLAFTSTMTILLLLHLDS